MQLSFEFACSNQFDIYDNQDSFDMNEIDTGISWSCFLFLLQRAGNRKKDCHCNIPERTS